MHQSRLVLRFVLSTLLIVGLVGCAYIYANPYALHRVTTVPYDEFDTAPTPEGPVVLDSHHAPISFALPYLAFSDVTITDIRDAIGEGQRTDFDTMVGCVQLVRARLNATDRIKPKATTADAEELYRSGTDLFCLCSEHAILLNEMLQALQLQSRVLWLEGHVVAEYYDRDYGKWVFVDPHMNAIFTGPDGTPMSAAELILSAEQSATVSPSPICAEIDEACSLQHSDIDQLWYRNILLNGECYALSGTTLRDPSRWTHLAKFWQFPQMLVLETIHDSSHAKYIEPFRLRKFILLCLAFVIAYHCLSRCIHRPRVRPSDDT